MGYFYFVARQEQITIYVIGITISKNEYVFWYSVYLLIPTVNTILHHSVSRVVVGWSEMVHRYRLVILRNEGFILHFSLQKIGGEKIEIRRTMKVNGRTIRIEPRVLEEDLWIDIDIGHGYELFSNLYECILGDDGELDVNLSRVYHLYHEDELICTFESVDAAMSEAIENPDGYRKRIFDMFKEYLQEREKSSIVLSIRRRYLKSVLPNRVSTKKQVKQTEVSA